MTPELWLRVSQALDEAAELVPAERAAYLGRLREHDADAAAEVESLLQERPATLDKVRDRLLANIDTATGADAFAATIADDWPVRIGPYEVQDEVARGGMGMVLRAWDAKFHRLLAVKILDQRHAGDESLVRRFREEAQIMGQLQHPGIPPVHDMGEEGGRPFLAMKLIQGQTFEKLLQDEPRLDLPSCLGIFAQVCQTMAYAHARGVLHRDLKPANIMVGKFGEVQVMDWGLVKVLDRKDAPAKATNTTRIQVIRQSPQEASKTMAGSVMGTLAYMSPEQAHADEALDERIDVFSLGAILCQILTGQPPYLGSTVTELLRKAMGADLSDAWRRLDECGAEPELNRLARRCLEPDPALRLRNAGEVAGVVADYLQSVQARLQQAKMEQAQAEARAEEEHKRRRVEHQKRRMTLALAVSLLVLMLGAAAAAMWYAQHQVEKAKAEVAKRADLLKRLEQFTIALDEEERSAKMLSARLGHYRKVQDLVNDLDGWDGQLQQRADTLHRAQSYLDSTHEHLDADLEERLQRQQVALDADQQAFALARELDAIQLESFMSLEARWNPTAAGPKYAQFFLQRLKLDVEHAEAAQTAAAINKSPLRHVLVAALDHWSELSQHPDSDYKDLLPQLLKITQVADADAWRDRFRDPEAWKSRPKLEQLAAEVKSTEQSAQILMALANQLDRQGGKGVAVAQSALVHYPRNFWLYLTTANLLKDPAEKTGYCQAALAVRPDNPVASNNLAMALYQHKKMMQAVEAFEKLIERYPRYSSVSNQLGVSYAALGKVLMAQGRFADAKKKYLQALKRLPEDDIAPLTEQLRECDRCLALQQSEGLRPLAAAEVPADITGQLTPQDPVDFYPQPKRFRAIQPVRLSKGKTYQIDLRSPDFDTVLRIENAKWQALLSNDDFGPIGKTPPETNSRLIFSPTEDGVHRLVVNSLEDKTGAYTLTLRETAVTGETKLIKGELRNTDEKTIEGRYSRKHEIQMQAGTPYVIQLESQAFDTYLKLQDKDGKVQSWNDDISPDNWLRSRIDFTPQQTATYVLLVTSYQMGEVGAYTLTVNNYTTAR